MHNEELHNLHASPNIIIIKIKIMTIIFPVVLYCMGVKPIAKSI
jgi:hypothetical protein